MKNIDIQYIDPDDFYDTKIFRAAFKLKKILIDKETWLFSGIWIEKKGLFLQATYPVFTVTCKYQVFIDMLDSNFPTNAIFYSIAPPIYSEKKIYLVVHCPEIAKILYNEWC